MKKILTLIAAVAFIAAPVFGTVYTDPIDDLDAAVNNDNLNFTGAEVTNDVTTISFTIKILGDIQSVNWGKYMIGIDSVAGGDTNGNGWVRPISMSSGMDYWLGGWVDNGGGFQVWKWEASAWNQTTNYVPVITANSATYTVNLSDLGLAPGSSFTFDIYSSGGGGGDTAIDALSLSTATVTNWPEFYDSGANVSTYAIPIPEPASIFLILLGLGLLKFRK